MTYQNRIWYICGGLNSFAMSGDDRRVIRIACPDCENVTKHRPICDAWSGSWEMERSA